MTHDADLPDSVEESELPALLPALLERSANGGATVVTRGGEPIAAIMSMTDYRVAEDAIDEALAARPREADDGRRFSFEDVFGDEDDAAEGDR